MPLIVWQILFLLCLAPDKDLSKCVSAKIETGHTKQGKLTSRVSATNMCTVTLDVLEVYIKYIDARGARIGDQLTPALIAGDVKPGESVISEQEISPGFGYLLAQEIDHVAFRSISINPYSKKDSR